MLENIYHLVPFILRNIICFINFRRVPGYDTSVWNNKSKIKLEVTTESFIFMSGDLKWKEIKWQFQLTRYSRLYPIPPVYTSLTRIPFCSNLSHISILYQKLLNFRKKSLSAEQQKDFFGYGLIRGHNLCHHRWHVKIVCLLYA